jgi:predicted transcriptional regulator
MEVTVKLPKNLYKDVSQIAQARKKSVAEIIENAVRKEVAEDEARTKKQVEALKQSVLFCSDKEVLELAKLKISEKQDKQLSALLRKNSEGRITEKEKVKLEQLMQICRALTLRKAIGMSEATKRGLIKTPSDLK